MRCTRCGTAIRPGSTICPNCGATVRRWQPGHVRCRHCGQRVPAYGRLCPACGRELQRSWRPLVLAVLTVALVAAGYWALTRVVTIDRIRQQVEQLPTVSLVALLPQATPTFTLTPTQTVEVRPTPTRIPTATPFLSPTPTATATTTTTPTATRRPPTATPAFAYAAPQLMGPASGTEFAGTSTTILLSWAPVAGLAGDAGYAVSLRYQVNGQAQTLVQWVQGANWVVPAELHDRLDPANPVVQWSVRITRGTADGEPLSAPSATWSFDWR